MSKGDGKGGGGCRLWGCVSTIVCLIVLWALLFGATIGGRHYGVTCSGSKGVEVEWGTPPR